MRTLTQALIILVAIFCNVAFAQTDPTLLLNSAEKGDVKAIQKAIASGIEVDAHDQTGWTALMKAASKGKLSAVITLLNAGADVNAKSSQGYTPLMTSVLSGNLAIVKLLLSNGADASATTPQGLTALDGAKRSGNEPLIKLLSKVTHPTPVKPIAAPTVPVKEAISKEAISAKTEQAAQAFRDGDYPHAITLFREVTVLNPQDALVWHFLGQALSKTNDNMGARLAFAKTLEIQPNGQLADRTRELIAKLPEPDLFSFKLDNGLTLGDWLPIAEQRNLNGQSSDVLVEANHYLEQYGPIPQIQRIRDKIIEKQKLQHESELQNSISQIHVRDPATAQAALPQIQPLLDANPNNLRLLRMKAQACHLIKDFECAVTSYTAWLNASKGEHPNRKEMVNGLLLAQKGEPSGIQQKQLINLPFELEAESRHLLEDSDVFQEWPDSNAAQVVSLGNVSTNIQRSSVPIGNALKLADTPITWNIESTIQVDTLESGVFKKSDTQNMHFPDSPTNTSNITGFSVLGGLLSLDPSFKIRSIKGSIFPLGSGMSLAIEAESFDKSGKLLSSFKKTCKSGEMILANSLHPKLTGNAYRIQCDIVLTTYDGVVKKSSEFIANDYFIESMVLLASTIGAQAQVQSRDDNAIADPQQNMLITYFFPAQGGTIQSEVKHSNDGNYQSTSTTTQQYSFVDLTIKVK